MRASINYGDEKIDYQVIDNDNLTTKILIHVYPNGAVEVEAPSTKSRTDVTKAIYKRAGWISRKLEEASQVRKHVLPREYVSGETHFYLGRRYQLKIIKPETKETSVKLIGGRIQIELLVSDRTAVKRRLNRWYRDRAYSYFEKRIKEVGQSLPWVDEIPQIKLVGMSKQWGSCSPKGAVHLNPWLIRAPRECVDYVILHELCHLKEHNHSKRFYTLLDRHCVDWKHTKAKLDGMAELLLAV